MKMMLSCKESVRLILAGEDRELSRTERMTLGFHLWMCSKCPEYRQQVGQIRRHLDRWNPYRSTDI
jgi:hypothetical protein